MSLDNAVITDAYVRHVTSEGGDKVVDIAWSTRAHGFGVLTIIQKDGETLIDSEQVSSEFVKRVLCKLVDVARRIE